MINIMIHRLGEILKERGAKIAISNVSGIPASVVSDLCSGKDRLNEEHIEKISKALGIPPWHLFVRPEEVIPPEYIALMEDYRRLQGVRKVMVDDALLAAKVEGEKKSPEKNGRTRTR